MHYLFGQTLEQPADVALIESALQTARQKRLSLARTPVEQIVEVFDRVGGLWEPGGAYFSSAMAKLEPEGDFSTAMIEATLRLVPSLCSKGTLRARLSADLGDAAILDGFISRRGFAGKVRAFPFGTLLHVSAGNVFLGCVDSLINGLLTKNVSLVKLSGRNRHFPLLFAQSIAQADPRNVIADKFALLAWPGGEGPIEDLLKRRVDAIVAWGGDDMVRSYRQGLGTGVDLIEHGPKISFQVIFKEAFDRCAAAGPIDLLADRIAKDVCTWDQSACSSPQNLFFQQGLDAAALVDAIALAFERYPIPRGNLSDDEKVELLKESARGEYAELVEGGSHRTGPQGLVRFDPKPGLVPSALNRSLILKRFTTVEDLAEQVASFGPVLQTCSHLSFGEDRNQLLSRLGAIGVQRFTPIGEAMNAALGAPHDGRQPLGELVRWVADEATTEQADPALLFINRAIESVPYYRALYPEAPLDSLKQLKPITSAVFAEQSVLKSQALLNPERRPGYYFASGGTTGAPKVAFYSFDELDRVARLLAKGFAAAGIGKGTLCANLFVAGNLWSSFLAVDRALAHCGADVLPIAGNADEDLILSALRDFRPQFALGLPTLLSSLAIRSKERGFSIEVPSVCYAGEHLSGPLRSQLEAIWRTRRFASAGYASVDAGPIGYQCAFCQEREHHVFADGVLLEISEEGEGLVTSLIREQMPVIQLRTGDHLEWSKPSDATCPCGSSEPKFILRGRLDDQLNLWGSRIWLVEIEQALASAGLSTPTFQVILEAGGAGDRMTIQVESEQPLSVDSVEIANRLHRISKDLHATHPERFLHGKLTVGQVSPGEIERIPRTGKLRRIRDLR